MTLELLPSLSRPTQSVGLSRHPGSGFASDATSWILIPRRQSKSVTTSHAQFRIPPPAGVRSSLMPSGTVNVMVTSPPKTSVKKH